MSLQLIDREDVASLVGQEREDGHNYFFLLITTENPPGNYPKIVENALLNNAGEWKKVDTEKVRYYLGHFESERVAGRNRIEIKNYIESQAPAGTRPHLILSKAFDYRPETVNAD